MRPYKRDRSPAKPRGRILATYSYRRKSSLSVASIR
jgi:hypothetical protein